MRAASTSGLILLSTIVVAGGALAYFSPDAARDILLRYLERGRTMQMIAIVEQFAGGDGERSMQLKMEQDRLGRVRTTVLQPLSKQGLIKIDDGRKWTTYQPDEARVIVQESPRLRQDNARFRIGLADQNYKLSVENAAPVAGRGVVVVVAESRWTEMPTRRYTIDPIRNVLMRLEASGENGERRLLLDTKAISFPSSMSPQAFQLKPVENVRTITLEAPIPIESSDQARRLAGFDPIIPRQLPFGFVVRDPELSGKDDCRFVAVRITDGLIYATVYQFKEGSGARPGRQRPDERIVHGIRIHIEGDLPSFVERKLLDSFAREAERVLGPTSELIVDLEMFLQNIRFLSATGCVRKAPASLECAPASLANPG